MGTKRYGILYAVCYGCVFSVIALSLMAIVTIITVDSGYGSENIQAIKDDGNCNGPDTGVSPNDSDNTFRSLAVHPTDPNTVIFGNEGNGFFKSTDGGSNWSRPNRGLYYDDGFQGDPCVYPEIYQIIFDSNDPTRLYAATTSGPGASSTPVTQIAGVYYSLDGGDTWTQSVRGLHNYAVTAIAQDPSDSDVLYIGLDNAPPTNTSVTETTSGPNIYKSTDNGLNWSGLTLPVTDNRIHNILVDPSNSDVVYCSGFHSYYSSDMDSHHLGFAKSTNGGATWSRINNSLDSLREPFIALDPNNPSTLYASVWTNDGAKAYKSTDRGENWTLFSGSGAANNLAKLKVSPFSSNRLIGYCSDGICSTTDGGTTWKVALDLRASDWIFNDIEFTSDPQIVYASTDHLKVFKSVDGGATFTDVSYPIPDIKANGKDGPITVSPNESVLITVSLHTGGYAGQNADWWLVEATPAGTLDYLDLGTGSMVQGFLPTYQGALFSLGTTQLLNLSTLTVGSHTFYFGVDLSMNGSLDTGVLYYDWVFVTVTDQ